MYLGRGKSKYYVQCMPIVVMLVIYMYIEQCTDEHDVHVYRFLGYSWLQREHVFNSYFQTLEVLSSPSLGVHVSVG